MRPEDFERKLQQNAAQLKNYVDTRLPVKMGNIALRFINGNFRAQGFQGVTFQRWKKNRRNGTILIKSGKLRSANHYTTQPGQATVKNVMPYSKAHNEGFIGTVSAKAHTRNQYSKKKVETGGLTKSGKKRTKTVTYKTGQNLVRAHTRSMNMPKRQFIPTATSRSPILDNAILREVEKDIKQILQ